MATVSIASTPASMQMIWLNGRAGTQIISFGLTELGQNPDITGARLKYESTYGARDQFTATIGGRRVNMPNGVTEVFIADASDILKGSSINVTVDYHGDFGGDGTKRTTNVAFFLDVTLAGQVVTDTRSTGELNKTTVTFDETAAITVTPQAGFAERYKHQITWKLGGWQTQHALAVGTLTDSFAVPAAWASAIPSSASGTMKVILDTLDTQDSDRSVGTREYSVTVTVPNTPAYLPTAGNLSVRIINPPALSDTGYIHAGVSRLELTLTGAAGGAGSPIASIVYSGWGETISSQASTVTTGVVQRTGQLSIEALITDGRGRQVAVNVQMASYQYNPPYFEDGIQMARCRPDGTPDDRGTAFKVNAGFGCDPAAVPGNTATAYVAIREHNTETWSAETELNNGSDTVVTVMTLQALTGYDVRFRVADLVMSVYAYGDVPTNQLMLHFANNGRSIGIGQVAEALGTGEEGRVAFNPEWTVHLGPKTYIGGHHLGDLPAALDAALEQINQLWHAVRKLQEGGSG